MFEIYREVEYDRLYRVVFFTELDEHNKEREIGRAMAGEHFFDGFIKSRRRSEGRDRIEQIVRRLNDGESLSPEGVERELVEADILAA